jgi:hypothetical protein
MRPGDFIVLHLVHPTEKLWGRLLRLNAAGVSFRGLQLESFEEWRRELGRGDEPGTAPTTQFVPMHRVERLFLDETVGEVESYSARFERTTGLLVAEAVVAVSLR